MLKIKFAILFTLFVAKCYSQEIMPYEKSIENADNYNFHNYQILQAEENFNISGTLITPKDNYDRIVIIVPGSGKDTRNSHFLLTQHLLDNKMAVFRYDERGVGLSGGKYSTHGYTLSNMVSDFTFVFKDLKNDKMFVNKKIGLIGHSFGGLVTIGAIEKGVKCDFLIQWATPVQRAKDFFKYQIKTGINKQEKTLNYANDEMKFAVMDSIQKIIDDNSTLDNSTLRKIIFKSLKKYGYKKDDYGWYISYRSYYDLLRKDFTTTYKNIEIPTLYIIGDNDDFVDPNENIKLLESFDNEKISFKVFKSLNHYLNKNELIVPNIAIYEIDKDAKEYISNWILNSN